LKYNISEKILDSEWAKLSRYSDELGDQSRIQAGRRVFFFFYNVHTGCGIHPASYPIGTGTISPEDKPVGA
jgi:hypothetical protein